MTENKRRWDSLPKEIRLMILETLLQDGCSLASLATVSREWQTIIEKHNFARIKVTLSRLRNFGSMVHRNRALVRYIWFHMELPKYGCMDCESIDNIPNRGTVVCKCVFHDLFSVLSTWEPHGTLVLDISFHSPNDPEHWFPGLTYLPDIPSKEEFELTFCGKDRPKVASPEDNKHGWADGSPPCLALHKITENVKIGRLKENKGLCPLEGLDYAWSRRLPATPAVTGFLLRQQNRRLLDPYEVKRMFELCTGLQEVYYEPWRQWDHPKQFEIDKQYTRLLSPPLPIHVRKLVLFENFDLRLPLEPDPMSFDYFIRIPSDDISRGVARNSLMLEHFSAAFMVDATTFFEARQPHWTWPRLKTIALTSEVLMPEDPMPEDPMPEELGDEELGDEVELNQVIREVVAAAATKLKRVLRDAAAAAAAMPNLETMEIWNWGEGFAGLFRYRSARGGRTAGITWRGTWDLALPNDVVRAWEAVRRKEEDAMYGYLRSQLVVEKEMLDAYKIRFHGDAIHYLGLEAEVIRPVSLYQMRMERDIEDMWY